MSLVDWLAVSAISALVLYAGLVGGLLLVGRRGAARALGLFIPDCLVLLRRLLADDRVPTRRKLVLVALVGYLALPIDLVPDFIPIAGQLDDVIVAALALRYVLRSGESGAAARSTGRDPRRRSTLSFAWPTVASMVPRCPKGNRGRELRGGHRPPKAVKLRRVCDAASESDLTGRSAERVIADDVGRNE